MSTIRIQGKELEYKDSDVITFEEGFIGLPHLKQMVMVRQTEIEPLMWLASLDDENVAFLVVDPNTLFENYAPRVSPEALSSLGISNKYEQPLMLTTVLIAPEWDKSTVNLRAPLLVSTSQMKGAQTILSNTPYRPDEPLPLNQAASA